MPEGKKFKGFKGGFKRGGGRRFIARDASGKFASTGGGAKRFGSGGSRSTSSLLARAEAVRPKGAANRKIKRRGAIAAGVLGTAALGIAATRNPAARAALIQGVKSGRVLGRARLGRRQASGLVRGVAKKSSAAARLARSKASGSIRGLGVKVSEVARSSGATARARLVRAKASGAVRASGLPAKARLARAKASGAVRASRLPGIARLGRAKISGTARSVGAAVTGATAAVTKATRAGGVSRLARQKASKATRSFKRVKTTARKALRGRKAPKKTTTSRPAPRSINIE